MSEALVLYTHPYSRGRLARWMLEEVGEPYEVVVLEYGTTMKAPDYLALNPMGKVPTVRHGAAIVTETAAICAYLADAFPAVRLAPPPEARGAYYRWLFFAAGPLETAVLARVMGFEPTPRQQTTAGFGSYQAVLDTLEKTLEGQRYIAGDGFTAADLYLGGQLGWGLQFGTIEKRPAFDAYWARLSVRDAYRRAAALDDALVPRNAD